MSTFGEMQRCLRFVFKIASWRLAHLRMGTDMLDMQISAANCLILMGELGIYMYRGKWSTRINDPRLSWLAPYFFSPSRIVLDAVWSPYFLDLTSCSRPLT